MSKSNVYDYSDAYILALGDISIIGHNAATQKLFKNCVPSTNCITKIDGTTIGDAEDLDLVMVTYNLLEYSSNYSHTTGILWIYSKDEPNLSAIRYSRRWSKWSLNNK